MNDIDNINFEGEPVKLDRVRHIKYTIRGLKLIARKHGSVIKAFADMKTMDENFTVETMDHLVMLLHAGLIHEDAKLTVDDVENMLTIENMPVVFNTIIKAFSGSIPVAKEDEVSEDEPGKPE